MCVSFTYKNTRGLRTFVKLYFSSRRKHSTMTHPKRYFVNPFSDYQGGTVDIPEQPWKAKIFQTINIIEDRQTSDKDADGGLYVGAGGIGYMFYYLSQHPTFKDERIVLLQHGLTYIKAATSYADSHNNDVSQKSAFLLGNAGAYAVAAAMYHAAGDGPRVQRYLSSFVEAAANCKPVNFLRCGGDELFIGRAGYLCLSLWLEKLFGKEIVPIHQLHEICSSIIQSGRAYAQRYRSPCPLMFSYYDVEYLGAAHGLCSILQMLISFPEFMKSHSKVEHDVKASVDYLLSLQTSSGNFPCAMDEIGSRSRGETEELVHWCHGAPGVVYMMAKAYLLWKDDKYLDSCLRCGNLVWHKGLLKKGPGICHGVAGNAYVFLLLYRLTSNPMHLHRAKVFADYIFTSDFKKDARTPDCPHSLYEGLAGTMCFLADLLKPEQAAFPFMDVF